MYQGIKRFIYGIFGCRFRYACLCGWIGNVCSWTDTGDNRGTHRPVCPHCFTRLK